MGNKVFTFDQYPFCHFSRSQQNSRCKPTHLPSVFSLWTSIFTSPHGTMLTAFADVRTDVAGCQIGWFTPTLSQIYMADSPTKNTCQKKELCSDHFFSSFPTQGFSLRILLLSQMEPYLPPSFSMTGSVQLRGALAQPAPGMTSFFVYIRNNQPISLETLAQLLLLQQTKLAHKFRTTWLLIPPTKTLWVLTK